MLSLLFFLILEKGVPSESVSESFNDSTFSASSGTNEAIEIGIECDSCLAEETIALRRADSDADDTRRRGLEEVVFELNPCFKEGECVSNTVKGQARNLDPSLSFFYRQNPLHSARPT